ncbi:hypothetical protein GA0115246_1088311 [Streptomyces sp. SolWspMP-sol7th]|nr:hypothetical protein GA0115246_1088311 [Streptomyces sp. SolWspMP-sol7th]
MIGQHGTRRGGTGVPVRYEAIDEALRLGATVHLPRIGCGLAGGQWDLVEPLIRERLTQRGVGVTVYDVE